MNHFPIYIKTADKRVCIIGNGDNAVAKVRLVGKSEAVIEIYADAPNAMLMMNCVLAMSKISFCLMCRNRIF